MAGKGDKYRPVDRTKYDDNYEKIFGNKKVSIAEQYHIDHPGVLPESKDECDIGGTCGLLISCKECYIGAKNHCRVSDCKFCGRLQCKERRHESTNKSD